MLLASKDEVLARMGLTERTGTESSVQSALYGATSALENVIRTQLNRQERIDYFGNVRNQRSARGEYEFLLLLENGFLDPEERVRVYVSNDGNPILRVTDTNSTLADPDGIDIDYDRGKVTIGNDVSLYSPSKRRCIAVRYVSGYEVSDASDPFAVATGVPDKIKNAAIALAIGVLRSSNAPIPKTNQAQQMQALSSEARRYAANLIRTKPRGDFTEATEIL